MYYWLSASILPTDDAIWPRYGGQGEGPVFDGKPLTDSWVGLPCIVNPGQACNFMHFKPGALLCDKQAKDFIFPYVEKEAEFLPFDIGIGKDVFLLNVTNVIDALDQESSEIKYFPHNGRFMDVKKYAFREEMLKDAYLFKVPLTSAREVLCTERFRELIQSFPLVGLRMVPLPLVAEG